MEIRYAPGARQRPGALFSPNAENRVRQTPLALFAYAPGLSRLCRWIDGRLTGGDGDIGDVGGHLVVLRARIGPEFTQGNATKRGPLARALLVGHGCPNQGVFRT